MALETNPAHRPEDPCSTSVMITHGTAQRNNPVKLTLLEKNTMAMPKATLARLEMSMETSRSMSACILSRTSAKAPDGEIQHHENNRDASKIEAPRFCNSEASG